MTALAMLAVLLAVADPVATAAPIDAGFTAAPEARPALLPRTKAERGPWLELDAGPTWLHHSGLRGLSSGPQVRFSLGTQLGERAAAEVWLAGSLRSSSRAQLGDEGAAGGGLGARLLLHDFHPEGTLQLFARGGLGYMAATTDGAPHGASGFAGLLLLLKPPVKRFALGIELDATSVGRAFGFALLPTLRCAL